MKVVDLFPGCNDGSDVCNFLDLHDAEDLDRLAFQSAEWSASVSTELVLSELKPYRGDESMVALRRMADVSKQLRETMGTLAEQVAQWFDRKGPTTLTGIEFALPYTAKALDISVSYLHRLNKIGRVRRAMRGCEPPVHTPLTFSDRALLPFCRILDAKPEAFPEAVRAASAMASAEAIEAGRPKPKPVNKRQASMVVDSILGSVVTQTHTPVKRKPPTNARSLEIDGIRRRVEELAACTAAILGDGIPADIRARIVALAEQGWCQQ